MIIIITDPLYSDICTPNPCLNGGICNDEINGFNCTCVEGFAGETCQFDITIECNLVICLNGGRCVDNGNDFICICAPGFTGTVCEVRTSECVDNPCLNGGTCREVLNSSNYTCMCLEGYTGHLCETNIDDCIQVDRGNGTCRDGIKSFSCECLSGYTGEFNLRD